MSCARTSRSSALRQLPNSFLFILLLARNKLVPRVRNGLYILEAVGSRPHWRAALLLSTFIEHRALVYQILSKVLWVYLFVQLRFQIVIKTLV
jgi:hypothetical protein